MTQSMAKDLAYTPFFGISSLIYTEKEVWSCGIQPLINGVAKGNQCFWARNHPWCRIYHREEWVSFGRCFDDKMVTHKHSYTHYFSLIHPEEKMWSCGTQPMSLVDHNVCVCHI